MLLGGGITPLVGLIDKDPTGASRWGPWTAWARGGQDAHLLTLRSSSGDRT